MQIPCNLMPPSSPSPRRMDVRIDHAHALLAEGIRATLARHAATAGGSTESAQRVRVTDFGRALQLPPGDGAVLVVESGLTVPKLRTLLHAGVQGCVSADGDATELLLAIEALSSGATYFCPVASNLLADALQSSELTEREQRVLELLCEGLDNKSIAQRLHIALGTVKCHVKAILGKTGTRTRTAVAARAIRLGWVGHAG